MIENAPTVNRNVYDVAKLSPLVNTNKFGGISIAGTNNRYNSFQIDGMVSNDVFGLTLQVQMVVRLVLTQFHGRY